MKNNTNVVKNRKITIMITESQLKMLAKNLLIEQEQKPRLKLHKVN
jgi:hypothetical protein